jgi:diguanylate cyclase (GGDEF)-like protein/PAS domain S-box-containing protein
MLTASAVSCPFCQSQAAQTTATGTQGWAVRCPGCGAQGPVATSEADAREHWSRAHQGAQLLRTVIDESPDIILMKDWDGRFLLGNRALATLYGTTPEGLVGKDDGHFNPNREQVDFYLENVRSVMRSGQTQIVQESSTNAETGEVRHFHSIKKPLTGPDGEPRILVIAHDVTDLQRAHEVIEHRERSYAYAMAAAGEGIWDWDIPSGTVVHNGKWCELFGFDTSHLIHCIDEFVALLHEDDRETVEQALKAALAGEAPAYEHEHRMRRKDGSVFWVLDRGRVVERDDSGQPLRMAGSVTDITERKRVEQMLLQTRDALAQSNAMLEQKVADRTAELARANSELTLLARRDALTGLPNRLAANERLHEEFARMKRSGTGYAVLMMDIDHFKAINDTHGHAVGDGVLRHTAELLKESIRESDFVARFGGEEFIAILPDTDLEGARRVAEKIRQTVDAVHAPVTGHITISIGLALADPAHRDVEQALRLADSRLYEAKRSGRNRLVSN